MSTTRIYRVNDYLVEASSQAAAVNHIARGTISVRVATQRDLVELRDAGVQIQRAGKPWSVADVKVVIRVPEFVPEAAKAAGEEYLRTAGAKATHEGLVEAMFSAVMWDVEFPSLKEIAAETGARVAETDATGKPTHIVLEPSSAQEGATR